MSKNNISKWDWFGSTHVITDRTLENVIRECWVQHETMSGGINSFFVTVCNKKTLNDFERFGIITCNLQVIIPNRLKFIIEKTFSINAEEN